MQSLNGDGLPKYKENRKRLVPNDSSTTLVYFMFLFIKNIMNIIVGMTPLWVIYANTLSGRYLGKVSLI